MTSRRFLSLTMLVLAAGSRLPLAPALLEASGGRPDSAPLAREDKKRRNAALYGEIRELFRAYELRNLVSFRQVIGLHARTADDNRFGTQGRQLAYAVNCDFQNLRDIQFTVTVYPPQHTDARRSNVLVTWYRRARFSSSSEEWITRGQRSKLYFDMSSPRPKLTLIEGAPLFGLCNQVEALVVDRGDIDGRPVRGIQTVMNGRLGQGRAQADAFLGRLRRRPGGAAAGLTAGRSDIEIAGLTVTAAPAPGDVSITASVRNRGAAATGPFGVTIDPDPAFPRAFVVTRNVPDLAPGATRTVNAVCPSALVGPGSRTVTVTADLAGAVAESDETNNARSQAYVVP